MKYILIIVLVVLAVNVQAQLITTYAGGGTASGDGGLATAAVIFSPNGGAFDNEGNYYFVEVLGNKVRKVNNSGIITTIAGTGSAGYNGDGGLADTSKLNTPGSVVCDSIGNIFIADVGNNRIRKIDKFTGQISTVAGNGINGFAIEGEMATASALRHPNDMCFDKKANLYISDADNFRILKVDGSGVISVYAGNGVMGDNGDGGAATNAQLSIPRSIVIDKQGNLFIADWTNNNKVRKVNVLGTITTVVGTGDVLYNGENVPGTSAHINPVKLVTDDYGNLFIADYYNNIVRVLDSKGLLNTIAGNTVAGFSGDGGLATAASLHGPSSITLDTCGNLYISEVTNARIRKVTFPACHYLSFNNLEVPNITIAMSPNPTTSTFTITSPTPISSIALHNAVGQVVLWQRVAGKEAVLDVAALPAGVYVVRVTDASGGVAVRRVVKE